MQTIKEKMQQRMRQILVHSCIYEFDMNIVDDTYDKWGNELVDLNKEIPTIPKKEIEFGLKIM